MPNERQFNLVVVGGRTKPRPRWLAEFSTTNETRAAVIYMASRRRSSVVLILACCLDRIFPPVQTCQVLLVSGRESCRNTSENMKYYISRAN